jgi:hypothetical protein
VASPLATHGESEQAFCDSWGIIFSFRSDGKPLVKGKTLCLPFSRIKTFCDTFYKMINNLDFLEISNFRKYL